MREAEKRYLELLESLNTETETKLLEVETETKKQAQD
jgi:hypothetical protein